MKVYSTYSNEKEKPQIKISNKKLHQVGFIIGSDYEIIYKDKTIILVVKENRK